MTQVLIRKTSEKYMYCTKTSERESFTLLFWTIPFDIWSWTLIGVTVIVLIIAVRGHWIYILAILLRQESYILNDRKILILAVLSAIVLTYGYEGVISSYLTVPEPFLIFKSLKDLLVNNYRIISQGPYVNALEEIFQRENITMELESSLVPNTWNASALEFIKLLSLCNATMPIETNSLQRIAYTAILELNFDVYCQLALKTLYSEDLVYSFHGSRQLDLARITVTFFESGILQFYSKYPDYVFSVQAVREGAAMEPDLVFDRLSTPLKLKQWKVLSIFLMWTTSIGVALLMLSIEIYFQVLRKYLMKISVIKVKSVRHMFTFYACGYERMVLTYRALTLRFCR